MNQAAPRQQGCSMALPALLILAGLVAAISVLRPGESRWLPQCPLFSLTGLYCPGCGSTRMLYYLVHGQPMLAFRQNALTMVVFTVLLVALLARSIVPGLRLPRLSRRWCIAFGALVLLFGVARNLPFEPLCRLAPGGLCEFRGK